MTIRLVRDDKPMLQEQQCARDAGLRWAHIRPRTPGETPPLLHAARQFA